MGTVIKKDSSLHRAGIFFYKFSQMLLFDQPTYQLTKFE